MIYIYSIYFSILSLLVWDKSIYESEDTYFKGFYHGRNVFIRNPYLESEKKFCIESIYLNGKKVTDSPNISAYELSMENLALDERVVIRIVHHGACKPQLINPEVIQEDLSFSWVNFYVNEESIIWVTSKEDRDAKYFVERELEGDWEIIDTVATKGGIFINQHSLEIDHNKGGNTYRISYLKPNGQMEISDSFYFFSDKREISHVVDTDNWVIEFTEEVGYQLLNENGRILLTGKGVSCNIRKLPRGTYILKYEGTEHEIEKSSR